MKTFTPLAALALLALAGPASAAPPTDVADVFPPGTLAYAELHGPADLGPQLAALFKGTPLEDSIPFIHGKKDAAKTLPELQAKGDLARLALLVSPEVLGEFRKLGGVAVGLVGFTKDGQPEAAVAVLTGDSAAAGLAARAFVTMGPNLRKVGEVSKVPVFQTRAPNISYDPNGNPQLATDRPPAEGQYEPTFAYTPGLFVAGTSKAALAPVVTRFVGEEKDGLRATAGFKLAAAEYRKPGLFFYLNAPEFFAKYTATTSARAGVPDLDPVAWLKLVAGPKALTAAAGCAQFRDGGIALTVGARLDPAHKSPLADFFAGPAAKVETLHHARKPAAFAATVSLPEKDRAGAVLALLDALAKGDGELGRLPSDVVKDIDAKHKMSVKADVLAKVRAVTVIVPAKQELPKGATAIPMLVFHAEDDASAAALEAFVPKLIAEIAGDKEPAQPATETVGGVKVFSLAGTGLPWKAAVHYARRGAALAVGLDRKLVAAAATPDAGASVAGGDKGPPLLPGAALVGALNVGALFGAFDRKPAADGPVRPVPPGEVPVPRLGGQFGELSRPPGSGPGAPAESQKEADKAWAAVLTAFGELPLATVAVRKVGDELRLEVFQPKVQGGGLTPVIHAGVNWFDKQTTTRDPNRNPRELFDISDGPRGRRW